MLSDPTYLCQQPVRHRAVANRFGFSRSDSELIR